MKIHITEDNETWLRKKAKKDKTAKVVATRYLTNVRKSKNLISLNKSY